MRVRTNNGILAGHEVVWRKINEHENAGHVSSGLIYRPKFSRLRFIIAHL